MQLTFEALADPTRRAFLRQLAGGPLPAGQLVPPVAMTQPGVSRHLRVLRRAGLVTTTRRGRQHVYALAPDALRQVADWLAHFEAFWEDRLDALDDALQIMADEEERGT